MYFLISLYFCFLMVCLFNRFKNFLYSLIIKLIYCNTIFLSNISCVSFRTVGEKFLFCRRQNMLRWLSSRCIKTKNVTRDFCHFFILLLNGIYIKKVCYCFCLKNILIKNSSLCYSIVEIMETDVFKKRIFYLGFFLTVGVILYFYYDDAWMVCK